MAIVQSVVKIVALVVMISLAVHLHEEAQGAITCGLVLRDISGCVGYAQRGGSVVPPACCDGLKSLNTATASTPDLQVACRCLKTLIPNVGAKPELVNSIPAKCNVNFPYQYSPSLDCSK